MRSSELVARQHQALFRSNKCKSAFALTCFKVDGKGGGGPPAHSRHFLDLWHPGSQLALFGFPVYFCCIQLVASRSSCTENALCTIFLSALVENHLLLNFFRVSLSSCFTASSTLRYASKFALYLCCSVYMLADDGFLRLLPV